MENIKTRFLLSKPSFMDPNKLLQADYLDIIFDDRNKNYGGYELRKNYNRRAKKAGAMALLGASAILCFSFMVVRGNAPKPPVVNTSGTVVTDVHLPPPPPVPPPPPPPPGAPPPPPAVKTVIFTPPVITETVPDDMHMTEVKKLADANPGPTTIDSGNPSSTASISGKGPATSTSAVVSTAKTNGPMIVVEQMPAFAGDMNKFIASIIRYPEQAREANVQGRVLLQFVVNEDGSISNVVIERGIGAGCDEEALRVIEAMPKWKPGKQNGIAVKVYYKIPIKFSLE